MRSTKQHSCFADCLTESYEQETFYLIIHGQNSYGPHKQAFIHFTHGMNDPCDMGDMILQLRLQPASILNYNVGGILHDHETDRKEFLLSTYQIYFNVLIIDIVSIFVIILSESLTLVLAINESRVSSNYDEALTMIYVNIRFNVIRRPVTKCVGL